LAIEYLLYKLRDKLQGVLCENRPITLSAYADDINVFKRSDTDVMNLKNALNI